jgi:hypothetical protein
MKDKEALFYEYKHNIGLIFSHFEGQYPYELMEEEDYLILLTLFDYHYVAGKVPNNEALFLQHIISYIKANEKEEFVLFAPNKEWEDFLEGIILKLGGVLDTRYLYHVKKEDLRVYPCEDCVIEEIKQEPSKHPLLQASLKEEGRVIAKATALMTGHSHVEIDVFTEESKRKKGLGLKVSSALVNELLSMDLVPDWTCWKIKKASQKIARKLGFHLDQEIKAFVWVNELRNRDLL